MNPPAASSAIDRPSLLERVGEAAVVQVYADGFAALTLTEKTLVWHLYQAALAGRDIFYDQRYAHSLAMRDILEAIVLHPDGVAPDTLAEIQRYTRLFWINTGPYNNLTARKFVLGCTPDAFSSAVHAARRSGAIFPLEAHETLDDMLARLRPMFFDPDFEPQVTTKTPPAGQDILTASANNLYVGVTMADLEGVHEEYPLNSRLVRAGETTIEEVYRIGGRYGGQIAAIVSHLTDALPYAPASMRRALEALIRFYETGATMDREAYDIAWVQDKESVVDTINGFIEVYLDARGMKGAWEGLVFYVNREKTSEIQKIAANAQWFEDRMPWDPKYKREGVRGVTANAIDVVIETGDSGPMTPVGINLPNDQVVREKYGSKSVSLSNITEAYEKSTLSEFRTEFCWSAEEVERAVRWGAIASELTTNMHEVIGHGSGKVEEHLNGNPQAALKEQFSALEESRADLVALYFLPDPKMVSLGLVGQEDHEELVRAEYEAYARTALVQLRRVREGDQIEEDHMRNRQMIVRWLMANTDAIEVRRRDGRTFYVMTDPAAFREGAGRLLAEVQRIKAQGDYAAAKQLFDAYGVRFDPALRDEIVARVDRLQLPSYTAFVMPKLEAVYRSADGSTTSAVPAPSGGSEQTPDSAPFGGPAPSSSAADEIADVVISYPRDLATQMLEYTAATRHLRR